MSKGSGCQRIARSGWGIRILMGDSFEKIVSLPTGSFTFGSNPGYGPFSLGKRWRVRRRKTAKLFCAWPGRMRLSSSSKTQRTAFRMLQWLRVAVRSSPASEEKMEFRFGADALGTDGSISFMVDCLS